MFYYKTLRNKGDSELMVQNLRVVERTLKIIFLKNVWTQDQIRNFVHKFKENANIVMTISIAL